jgi:serine/threonine-protein kinase
MNEPSSLLERLPDEAVLRFEKVCTRFEAAWKTGSRPSVEDFLDGAEGVERLARLRELLYLDVHYRRQSGEGPSPQEYESRFPDATAIVAEVFAREESPRPDTVDDAGHTGPHAPAPEAAEGPNGRGHDSAPAAVTAGRFQPLRFHARGALGQVFVAEDTELHREVALKEIMPARAGQQDSRARFVLEAEITGNLEHPGIVPVYGLGTYPDGRPFYAMRFIRGDTLADAIEHFHSRTPVRFDSLAFRQLLGRWMAVCQAIGYAHDRGVLHRDLKPGNIMLGKFGETLVVDWGLAKVVGRPDAAATGAGEEGLLRPSAEGAQTTVGVVGTPAYMSPEQAAAKVDELGPATDVYSLGATLYALLTNRAPFKGPVVEVVKQVEQGSWVPPRQVNGKVPAALDAVCRKAMALRPEERYSSALALAEDVEHWLADELVKAYREPVGARLRRWMRKRPKRVTAAVVLLLAAVVGLTVGTVLLERSNREARENLAMVEGQANFFMQEVSEDLLMNEPGMQELRQRILIKVLDDYADFLKKRPGDQHARQEMAGAKRQLGELFLQTGRVDEARVLEAQAVELYEGLLREGSADRGLRFGLARAWYLGADLQVQAGDPAEGTKEIDRAIELLERLIAEEPGNGDYLIELARSWDLHATAEGRQGHTAAALADSRRVLEIMAEEPPIMHGNRARHGLLGQRVLLSPSVLGLPTPGTGSGIDFPWPQLLLLGRACTNQGILLGMSGRGGEAARVLEQAVAVHQRLLERNPRASQFRPGLALALLHCGRVKVQLGLPGRAEPTLREALALLRRLSQEDPLVQEYRASRLLAAGCLGEALFRQGRTGAAVALLREVETDEEEVLDGWRTGHGMRGQYARLLHVLGCLELESGNLDRGFGLCLKAHEKMEQALGQTPGERWLRSDLLSNREVLVRCRFLKGDLTRTDWIREQEAILKERKDLVGQDPAAPRFQGESAGSAAVLADLLLEAGRPGEALACVEGVLPAHEKAARAEQDRVRTAAKEQQEAEPVPITGGNTGALRRFLRNMPIVPDFSLHRQWAMLLARRGAALARLGRDAEAVEAVRQAVAIDTGLLLGDRPFQPPPATPESLWAFLPTLFWPAESCHRYDLACHLALASTFHGYNGKPDPAEEAVRALRWCVASGFDNLHKLRTDPALEPLRKREDFWNLVRDLEAGSAERKDANLSPNVAGSTTK